MALTASFLRLILFSLSLHAGSWCRAELYTAISDLEPLLITHKRVIDNLDFYIEKEELRLLTLKRYLNIYKQEHEKAIKDVPNYLGNPIHAFTLIKRLTKDLNVIEDGISVSTAYLKNMTVAHLDVQYPTLEDLMGAAQALTRLQDTYRLQVSELAQGILNGVKYSTPMTADDCFVLGQLLFQNKDYTNALAWVMEAYRRYEEIDKDGRELMPHRDVDILDHIRLSHYFLGETKLALEWTNKLLELDPKHANALNSIPQYKSLIAEKEAEVKKLIMEGDVESSEEAAKEEKTKRGRLKSGRIESLCRNEMDISADISKKLKCWYLTENHAFLKYAPIKLEQMFIAPDIFIFHEVLYDDEIELIKSIAQPRFTRAQVTDSTGKPLSTQGRISKAAWISNEESPVIARISQRVADMTGLDMESAEQLQIVNYGIGGHFKSHLDFTQKHQVLLNETAGNRIATVLFYMSDVAQGGATVFKELGLSLFPIKRAAVFWLNLHPSGKGDKATVHAGCPVLRGSKWVGNIWLHQRGQELIKPCTLEYQPEGIYRKVPRPVVKTRGF